ncbi:MAG: zinc carboxypeptidase [Cyclobacteriaceae bacterium]|nr:zinc carboxypeptidase [Cyclobacteriaceae bacterium]
MLFQIHSQAQTDLSYYLPGNVKLNPKIPAPAALLGHDVGEWHVSHDKLVNYMYEMDRASDRISLLETGRTYEGRPLLLLTITSPANHSRIEAIRTKHLQLSDPGAAQPDLKDLPAVYYMGCSIHGNEPSGANAGLLLVYYLAAAQGPEIESYLDKVVVLFDPSFNPDGLQRFSSWVNARKSQHVSTDPNDVEHNEGWPSGRTNHYWFDLNRDWMVAQLPESKARIRQYQRWKPNVLTDHHEQGTNATFFFMPGEPTRVNPNTPRRNQELTRKMAAWHARALDEIGSLYFTQEGYDDFYYGKGSTYPDSQGAMGILFEQASSRGHAQESTNGILRFPFTIRNHFTSMLSSLKAVYDMREELLQYQYDFFHGVAALAAKDPVKAYAFTSKDAARTYHLAEIMARHEIQLYRPAAPLSIAGKLCNPEETYVVPLAQAQYHLLHGMFDKQLRFEDSLFYDISSWTLPLATGVEYEELKAVPALGARVSEPGFPMGTLTGKGDYAFVLEPYGYYLPRAIYRLLQANVRIKVATESFYHPDGSKLEQGSILIPVDNQTLNPQQLGVFIQTIREKDGVNVVAFDTGLDFQGASLGSSSFLTLRKPEIALLVEGGVSANDAGEIWHLLDERFGLPVTLLPLSIVNSGSLNRYTHIIFPAGNYGQITDGGKEKLRTWEQQGGVIIGFEQALNWLTTAGLGKFEMKKEEEKKENSAPRPYHEIETAKGAQETSGAIFVADVDLTNPLLYGYTSSRLPMFKSNNLFMEKAKGSYANPLSYGSASLISGYISKPNNNRMKNSAGIGMSVVGKGRTIGFTENVCFRAFWFGTNRLLMNAVYFGGQLAPEAGR